MFNLEFAWYSTYHYYSYKMLSINKIRGTSGVIRNIIKSFSTNINGTVFNEDHNLPQLSGILRKPNMMGSRTSRYMRRGMQICL